jgi:hypothetical protein
MRWSSLAAVCLGLSACSDGSAIKASESLVGAKDLPNAKVLSNEIIHINRGFDRWPTDPGALEYDLQPDNSVSITHVKIGGNWKRVVVGRETLHLPSDAASQARRMLWRLRPSTLQGIQVETRPLGCPAPPTDSSPAFFVDFISEGPKPGIADDKLGIVSVPNQRVCRSAEGAEARQLVERVLKSFPPSKVSADFDREVSLWEARIGS